SQPENGTGVGDGNTVRDCVYEPGALHLRAERDGACSPLGRVYTMTVVATDVCGNSAVSNPFEVGVWHDCGHGPTTGTIYSASPASNNNDSRNGTNGIYGVGCGPGTGAACGECGRATDHSDADPEMEIAQLASIDVNDLLVERGDGGDIELS